MPYLIKAKSEQGRYRGGKFHSRAGAVWDDAAFTKAQLAAIKKDSLLTLKKLTDAAAAEKRKELGQAEPSAENAAQEDAAEKKEE